MNSPRSFAHDDALWQAHPTLRATALTLDLAEPADRHPGEVAARVRTHLQHAPVGPGLPPESVLPSIAAWRAAFSRTGVRPTQYRCAAESLLRRLRTRGELPRVDPLVDLCNAVSARFAVPVAVLDLDRTVGDLRVRAATGAEVHEEFDGTSSRPAPGEIVYADDAGHAHSRRWCWRQSARSVVSPGTRHVLVVTEALHEGGDEVVRSVAAALGDDLGLLGSVTGGKVLTAADPEFRIGTGPL